MGRWFGICHHPGFLPTPLPARPSFPDTCLDCCIALMPSITLMMTAHPAVMLQAMAIEPIESSLLTRATYYCALARKLIFNKKHMHWESLLSWARELYVSPEVMKPPSFDFLPSPAEKSIHPLQTCSKVAVKGGKSKCHAWHMSSFKSS